MIYVTLAALGLDQKKQLCKALDRNEAVNVLQSSGSRAVSVPHWPSRAEQSTVLIAAETLPAARPTDELCA